MATPDNPMNRRRSERVMLQMKVTVIAEDVQRKSRQEEALTLVVNAHGGLLKMKMEMHVGQPMLLVNPQKSVEQNCRVIRVSTEPQVLAGRFSALGLGCSTRLMPRQATSAAGN